MAPVCGDGSIVFDADMMNDTSLMVKEEK